MRDVLGLLVPWIVTTTAVFALLAWDERRLSPDAKGRAFPVATRRAAVVVFGVLAVPVHFLRTRRGLRGMGLAIAWFALAVAFSLATSELTALLLPDAEETRRTAP